jgi:hypothetical protein
MQDVGSPEDKALNREELRLRLRESHVESTGHCQSVGGWMFLPARMAGPAIRTEGGLSFGLSLARRATELHRETGLFGSISKINRTEGFDAGAFAPALRQLGCTRGCHSSDSCLDLWHLKQAVSSPDHSSPSQPTFNPGAYRTIVREFFGIAFAFK